MTDLMTSTTNLTTARPALPTATLGVPMPASTTVRSILALTDFSEEARVAFEHALRLAVAVGADLHLLHLEPSAHQSADAWAPPVLETLVRWGFLPEGAVQADLARLGVRLEVSAITGMVPLDAIVAAIERTGADLVVMATHGRPGASLWHGPAVTVRLAELGIVPLLFIPPQHRGFINRVTGVSGLHRVLVPIGVLTHPGPVLEIIDALARALPTELCIATLHLGGHAPEPPWADAMPDWRFLQLTGSGDPATAILARAEAWNANLIVCATEGPRGLLDAFWDNTVKRLLDDARSPVLIVPHAWREELAVA